MWLDAIFKLPLLLILFARIRTWMLNCLSHIFNHYCHYSAHASDWKFFFIEMLSLIIFTSKFYPATILKFCFFKLHWVRPSFLPSITSLIPLFVLLIISSTIFHVRTLETINTLLVFLYICCPRGLVLQGLCVLLQLTGNKGEMLQRWTVVHGGILQPVHYMHYIFLPTGTS